MITQEDVLDALSIVHRHMAPTPQLAWPLLSRRLGADAWLKHENHSPIGSFKLRGALTYFADLAAAGGAPDTVVASTRGNHGQAVACAASHYGLRSIISVPIGNNAEKNEAMRAFGAELIEHGTEYQQAREYGQALAAEQGYHLVQSFTPSWLRGTATCAWELLNALPRLETLYVPVGMGSGLSAAILVKRILAHPVDIVGVVAEKAPAYALSFEAGRVVATDTADTIADGLSARVPLEAAVRLICDGAARFVTVSEDEILAAMRLCIEDSHNIAEPAAAAAIAAMIKEKRRNEGRQVAAVLTGGNASMALLRRCLDAGRCDEGGKP